MNFSTNLRIYAREWVCVCVEGMSKKYRDWKYIYQDKCNLAQSTGAAEYTNCISANG